MRSHGRVSPLISKILKFGVSTSSGTKQLEQYSRCPRRLDYPKSPFSIEHNLLLLLPRFIPPRPSIDFLQASRCHLFRHISNFAPCRACTNTRSPRKLRLPAIQQNPFSLTIYSLQACSAVWLNASRWCDVRGTQGAGRVGILFVIMIIGGYLACLPQWPI